MNESVFLSTLHESPDDELTWLALADSFEESGQSDRAELVRIVRQLRGMPVMRRSKKRIALEARLVELLLAGVKPAVPEVVNSIGMRFALIPAGSFRMGASMSEPNRESDEEPHLVEISRPFYLGVFPVTQKQFETVSGANPSTLCAGGELAKAVAGLDTSDFPVENIDYPSALDFCKRLGQLAAEKEAGHSYRLATEAEWEYACRACSTTATAFGDSLSSAEANLNGKEPYNGGAEGKHLGRTCVVGSYAPNGFGLYDMHGNVWEWCADWYDYYDLSAEAMKDPKGPETGNRRVVRGGAWLVSGEYSRSASRAYASEDEVDSITGFRVILVRK